MKKFNFKLALVGILLFAALLRFYRLDKNPPGLYWEEVALGYDAYSIAQTLHDHHGNFLPIIAFESFGDYKPALYFYFVAPLTKLIGLNAWAVRLPSAIAGIFLVYFISRLIEYFLKQLGEKSSTAINAYSLLAAFFAAISPWLIQFSRGGWESNLATTFIVGAVYLLLSKKSLQARIVALMLMAGAAYTYHAARFIAPALTMLVLSWQIFQKPTKAVLIKSISLAILLAVFMLPFVLPSQELAVRHRFRETSIFSNPEPVLESNWRRERAGNTLISRIFFHRYVYYGKLILNQAGEHLTLDYLLFSGDSNLRHGIGSGVLWPMDLLLIFVGLVAIAKKKPALLCLVFGWLVIVLLPASLAAAAPHSLRTLSLAPLYLVLVVSGAWFSYSWFKSSLLGRRIIWPVSLGAIFLYAFFFTAYWRYYLTVYPLDSASEWQVGYQSMISLVNSLQTEYPDLPTYINRHQGRPAMYYWFYSKTNPRLVQAEEATTAKDQGEFLQFANIFFIDQLSQVPPGEAIIAADPAQLEGWGRDWQIRSEIRQPNGTLVWQVAISK